MVLRKEMTIAAVASAMMAQHHPVEGFSFFNFFKGKDVSDKKTKRAFENEASHRRRRVGEGELKFLNTGNMDEFQLIENEVLNVVNESSEDDPSNEDSEFTISLLLESMSMETPTPTPTRNPTPTLAPTGIATTPPTPQPTLASTPSPTPQQTGGTPLPTPPQTVDTPSPTPQQTVGTPSPTAQETVPAPPLTSQPTLSIVTSPPSLSPVTPSPTPIPTPQPSLPPSPPPTLVPTASPTPSPTSSPTALPTPAPTFQCGVTPERREELISIVISLISNGRENIPGSPQNEAYNWLVFEDPAYTCPNDLFLIQRYVMAVFYYSTDGDEWTYCSAPLDFSDVESVAEANRNCNRTDSSIAWLTAGSECTWGNLTCNSRGFMEEIDLERNNVGGVLPPEIGRLQALRYLLVEDGKVGGVIPSEVGLLQELERLDLNFNFIGGNIPEQVYLLGNLRQLDLNGNELEGTISTRIGTLTELSFVQLDSNKLNGTIPNSLADLFLLEVGTFQMNQLSGVMPPLVCQNRSGLIEVLTADCLGAPGRPSPPFVACPCCTQCF